MLSLLQIRSFKLQPFQLCLLVNFAIRWCWRHTLMMHWKVLNIARVDLTFVVNRQLIEPPKLVSLTIRARSCRTAVSAAIARRDAIAVW